MLKKGSILILLTLLLVGSNRPIHSTSFEEQTAIRKISYEQMVDEIAELNNVERNVVETKFIEKAEQDVLSDGVDTKSLYEAVENKLKSTVYLTRRVQFTVTHQYKPSLVFYYEGYSDDMLGYVKRIINVSMDRTYKGFSKQFAGNVYVNLEDSDRIYYEVNGDFFDIGVPAVNNEVKININNSENIPFDALHIANQPKYVYFTDRIRIYNFGDI